MGDFDLQRRKGRISATKRTSDLAAIRACVVPSKTASLKDLSEYNSAWGLTRANSR